MVYCLSIITSNYHYERSISCQGRVKNVSFLARDLLSKMCAELIDFIKLIGPAIDKMKDVTKEIAKQVDWVGDQIQGHLDDVGIKLPVTPARIKEEADRVRREAEKRAKELADKAKSGIQSGAEKAKEVFGFVDISNFDHESKIINNEVDFNLVKKTDSDVYLCHEKGKEHACQMSLLFRGIQIGPKAIIDSVKSGKFTFKLKKLSEAVAEVKSFLDDHPKEIITIFLENYVDDKNKLENAFSSVRNMILTPPILDKYRKDHPGVSWPTIGWMQDNNKRIVILDSDSQTLLGFYDRDVLVESGYSTITPTNVCHVRHDAPDKMRTLYLLNLFPEFPIPIKPEEWSSFTSGMKDFMERNDFGNINSNVLRKTVDLCYTQGLLPDKPGNPIEMKGCYPNYLALDHVNRGNPFAFADELNKSKWPVWIKQVREYNQNTRKLLDMAAHGNYIQVAVVMKDPNFNINGTYKFLDKTSKDERTPLHLALLARPIDNVRKTISEILKDPTKKLNVNQTDGDKKTPVHYAANLGDVDTLHMLLNAGANINAQDKEGKTPLHYAMQKRAIPAVRLLVVGGANRNLQDNQGKKPSDYIPTMDPVIALSLKRALLTPQEQAALDHSLRVAAEKGDLNGVKNALSKGASINGQNVQGNTALMLAAYEGHEPVAGYLVQKQADRLLKNNAGQTAYDLAKMQKHNDIAKFAIPDQKKAALEVAATNRMFAAIKRKDLNAVQQALNEGARINNYDSKGKVPLHYGVNNIELLKFILNQPGILINRRATDGNTALHMAAAQGNMPAIQLLLAAGADTTELNGQGYIAEEVAQAKGKAQAAQLVQPTDQAALAKARKMALLTTFSMGKIPNLTQVKQMIQKGADVNAYAPYDPNVNVLYFLSAAGTAKDIPVAKELRAQGVKITEEYYQNALKRKQKKLAAALIPEVREQAQKDLMKAIQTNNLAKVREALSKGANINKQDDNGNTPLGLAIWDGANNQIIQELVNKGADKNIKNKNGQTPYRLGLIRQSQNKPVTEKALELVVNIDEDPTQYLFNAVNNVDDAAIKQAIAQGANVNAQNSKGETPLIVAANLFYPAPGQAAPDDWKIRGAIEVLIKNGANKNSKDKQGRTAYTILMNKIPSITHGNVTMQNDSPEYRRSIDLVNPR